MTDLSLASYEQVKKYVYNKLARRSYPSSELRHLLCEQAAANDLIERVIDECQSHGYINDEEWTERFIASQARRGKGPHVIKQKLRAKGVEVKTEGIASDQTAQIQELLTTKYRTRDLQNPKERQKVAASLVRRGFDFEAIRSALDNGF